MRTRSIVKLAALVAAGGLLVAAAVAGTRASGRLDPEFRPFLAVSTDALEVGLIVAAVLCVPVLLLGMILHRRAKDHAEESGGLRWRHRLILLAVVLASFVVLRELLPSADQRDAATDDAVRSPGEAVDVLGWSGRAGVLAVVLAGVAIAILWWRVHAGRDPARGVIAADADREAAAVRAGRAVLDERRDDPRAAVVGCYAAMEDALAATGAPRGRAESPEELLHRAIAEGRLPPEPGRRLTDLFLTARYSSALVTPADVAAGREALRRIDTRVHQ